MHPLFVQASGLTHDVIGAAIEVHRESLLRFLCSLLFSNLERSSFISSAI
jgi:hypothetical protein